MTFIKYCGMVTHCIMDAYQFMNIAEAVVIYFVASSYIYRQYEFMHVECIIY